jgi:short-subunit dehydrogenase
MASTSEPNTGALICDSPVALVTGASRGLGFLIAREFAQRGYALVLCARSGEGLAAAAEELGQVGAPVEVVEADVGVAEQARAVVATATERFGRLDVLVANAGFIQVGPAEVMGHEEFSEIMDSNFWGTLNTTLAALPLLRHTRGRILAVTSVGGKLPAPHLLPYTCAKHATVGFAEGLRIEASAQGVSVTVGVPGLMRTGSARNALFAGHPERERRWFTAAASMPILSMDAERAAARLVRATLRRRPEVVLTPLAKLGVRVHGLAPATTLRALTVLNRLLPRSAAQGTPQPGHLTLDRQPGWFARLTRRDRDAAHRWHELDDPAASR